MKSETCLRQASASSFFAAPPVVSHYHSFHGCQNAAVSDPVTGTDTFSALKCLLYACADLCREGTVVAIHCSCQFVQLCECLSVYIARSDNYAPLVHEQLCVHHFSVIYIPSLTPDPPSGDPENLFSSDTVSLFIS